MAVENFSISNDKVKLRYREHYTTEGSNEKATALPRGCYRGFVPRKSGVADASIWLAVDPLGYGLDDDSFAVYSSYNDGSPNYDAWALSVREIADVELDLSGSALIPIPGGVSYLYVYIEASYSIGSTTTATYNVSDEDPSEVASSNYNPDAILVGRIPVTAATSIIDFDITTPAVYTDVTTSRKWPTPTLTDDWTTLEAGDDRWGLIDSVRCWAVPTVDQKDAMDNANAPDAANAFATDAEIAVLQGEIDALEDVVVGQPSLVDVTGLSSATEFQLSGQNVYVGKGATGTADKYLMLTVYQDVQSLLRNATTGVQLVVQSVYDSTNSHELNPSTEADSAGFYANPWVKILSYTGNLSVYYNEKKALDTINQAPADMSALFSIAKRLVTALVDGEAVSGSPESLAVGALSGQLSALLGHVNDRIETIHPGGSTTPILLWRSHGITSDANVTPETISIYFSDFQIGIVIGGYVRGIDIYDSWLYTSSETASANVAVLNIGYDTYFGETSYLSSGTDFEYGDSNWIMAMYLKNNSANPNEIVRFDEGVLKYASGAYPYFLSPANPNAHYRARQRYISDYWIAEIMKETTLHRIANAELSTPGTGDTIVPVSATVPMSSMQMDGNSGQIRFLFTTQNKSGFSSGHGLASANFSAKLNIGEVAAEKSAGSLDYVYNCFNSLGNVYERIFVNEYMALSTSGSDDLAGGLGGGYNFRNRFDVAPSISDIHETGMSYSNCTYGVSATTKWGFRYDTVGITGNNPYNHYARGYVEVYS